MRVGVSIHHSVQSVALDTLVDHRLGGDASKVGVPGLEGSGSGAQRWQLAWPKRGAAQQHGAMCALRQEGVNTSHGAQPKPCRA